MTNPRDAHQMILSFAEQIKWNRLEPLSCDDPNPQTPPASDSGMLPSLSNYKYLIWFIRLRKTRRKDDKVNMHWGHHADLHDIVQARREWGLTENIPMSVGSPGAAGVVGVSRLGWLGVHFSAVQCCWGTGGVYVVWHRGYVSSSIWQRGASGIHQDWLRHQRAAVVATLTWETEGQRERTLH